MQNVEDVKPGIKIIAQPDQTTKVNNLLGFLIVTNPEVQSIGLCDKIDRPLDFKDKEGKNTYGHNLQLY